MLRFLLLRFLPRRLLPLLVVWEVIQLIRRLRGGRPLFGDDRIIEGQATVLSPSTTMATTRAPAGPSRAIEPPL
jgi:hypothetical protein